jgi:translation initiation factor 2B subunit (eIF-2B alpha/beta/delta family)
MKIFDFFKKRRKFNRIARNIRSIKIQGARNVAKKALEAYHLIPTKRSKKKLLSLRPTEPMLENVLELADKTEKEKILLHFKEAQEKINKIVSRLIKKNEIIFTHCHSTNVLNALSYSKKKGKNFEVYHTETRPLLQGRKTARDLKLSKIKSTMFIDSAINFALNGGNKKKRVNKIFLGADALVREGIINKVGSGTIAELAKNKKIPVYVIADSWKFTKNYVPIEQRKLNEIWDRAPKEIRIQNPAFEFVEKIYISKVITEKGIMSYDDFVRKMN